MHITDLILKKCNCQLVEIFIYCRPWTNDLNLIISHWRYLTRLGTIIVRVLCIIMSILLFSLQVDIHKYHREEVDKKQIIKKYIFLNYIQVNFPGICETKILLQYELKNIVIIHYLVKRLRKLYTIRFQNC